MYYFEVASEVDNMEDRHGRDEKGLSDKDEGAASNYQQQRERRHHSSHRNKGHGHRSKTEKTRSRYSPRNNESIENEPKIAGTVASPPPSYTVVGNNDVDRNDNQGYPNVGTERLSFGWDEEVCVLVEMGFTASQASHALNVCGGNTKAAYDFLSSSSNELVSSSRGGTQAAALFDFDSTKPRQVFDENVDGQVDYSSSTLNMTRSPQSNATPGAFRVGDSNSVAGTVIVGTPHQDVQNVQTGSIAPVEAEIVEDDLQERRELEAQLQRVLEERENAPVAQVVDTSNWWSKRRNRLCAERENAPIAQVPSTISSLTGMPSVQEAHCEDAGVRRKDIRRLYVLVCAALVLVLVGIIVAVSLSLTLGKQSAPPPANDLNNTSPTPASTENARPTTPEPVSMPSITPSDATTTSAPEQVTLSPVINSFPPTDPPGRNRRVAHRREGKVHPHLRSRGQSNQ
jgi:hypothetical protein